MLASPKGSRDFFCVFGLIDNSGAYGYPHYESRRLWDASWNIASETGTLTPPATLALWQLKGTPTRMSGAISYFLGGQYAVILEMLYNVSGSWTDSIPASAPSTIALIVDGAFKCTLSKGVTSYFNDNVGSLAVGSGDHAFTLIAGT